MFAFNLKEHISPCQYQTYICNHCKQSVILFEHESYCPEMPVRCKSCSTIILRKNIKVRLVVFMYVHAVQIPEEILCTIPALPPMFPFLSCSLVTFLLCSTFFCFFFLCMHALVKRESFEYNIQLPKCY